MILHLGQGGRKYTNVIQKNTGKLTIKFTYHTLHFITSIIMFIITKTKTCRIPSQGDEHPLCTWKYGLFPYFVHTISQYEFSSWIKFLSFCKFLCGKESCSKDISVLFHSRRSEAHPQAHVSIQVNKDWIDYFSIIAITR